MLPAGIPHMCHDLGCCSRVSVHANKWKIRTSIRIGGSRRRVLCWVNPVMRHRLAECYGQPFKFAMELRPSRVRPWGNLRVGKYSVSN